MSNNREAIFNELSLLSHRMNGLAGVVQNPGNITREEIDIFSQQATKINESFVKTVNLVIESYNNGTL